MIPAFKSRKSSTLFTVEWLHLKLQTIFQRPKNKSKVNKESPAYFAELDRSSPVQTFKSAPSEDLSLKFFLYLLETLVNHEFQNSTKKVLQSLLQSHNFGLAVAVLAVEVYGFINEESRIELPHLLDFFMVSAVDLWKVLYSVCSGHLSKRPTPKVLMIHLYELEVNLLMNNVWKCGSPLFAYLQKTKDQLQAEVEKQEEELHESYFDDYVSESNDQMSSSHPEVAANSA